MMLSPALTGTALVLLAANQAISNLPGRQGEYSQDTLSRIDTLSSPSATQGHSDKRLKQENKSRQLEVISFPVGVVIGAIGAAILPAFFPPKTTTTTTTPAPSASTTRNPIGDNSDYYYEEDDDDDDDDDDDSYDYDYDFSSTSKPTTTSTTTKTTTASTTTMIPPRTKLTDFQDCGVKGSYTRVVGGRPIKENEYPWLCSLKYDSHHICGVTLLSGPPHDCILVGAAHCYSVGDDPFKYTITCGEHNLRGNDDSEVNLQVTQVIIHKEYVEASSSGYDIAVYKVDCTALKGKMKKKKLWPACLPEVDNSYYREESYVAGWGVTQTRFVQGNKIIVKGIPDIANHARVTITDCKDTDGFDYPKGLICAAEDGQDSCQGDSGGPLNGIAHKYANREQTRYSWIGIVSFGVGCAEPGYPGAYTRASCFLGWVANQFNLTAEFTPAEQNTSWSKDCPVKASRRKIRNRNKNKKKNKNRNKSKNGNRNRNKNRNKTNKNKNKNKGKIIKSINEKNNTKINNDTIQINFKDEVDDLVLDETNSNVTESTEKKKEKEKVMKNYSFVNIQKAGNKKFRRSYSEKEPVSSSEPVIKKSSESVAVNTGSDNSRFNYRRHPLASAPINVKDYVIKYNTKNIGDIITEVQVSSGGLNIIRKN